MSEQKISENYTEMYAAAIKLGKGERFMQLHTHHDTSTSKSVHLMVMWEKGGIERLFFLYQ